MKTRFALWLAIGFVSVINAGAQQQGFQRPTVQERVKVTINKIADPLALDPTQKMKATNAYTDFYIAIDTIRQELPGGNRLQKVGMEKAISVRDGKLKIIFTEEQYKKFKDVVEPSLRKPPGDIPVNN